MDKPVLVLVMSQICGACQQFKKNSLPALENELKRDGRFRFIVFDFPDMNISTDGKDFHPELKNFVEFFPTFILFPSNLWNNHSSKLKGVPKHDLKKNPKVDYSKASIYNWIDENIKKEPFYREEKRERVPTLGTYNRFRSTKPTDSL